MQVYERDFDIEVSPGHYDLLTYFKTVITQHLKMNEIPIRLAVTSTDERHYHCELGIMSWTLNGSHSKPASIFDFRRREYENTEQFNAVLLIPTGVGAEIGGHAGDAGPITKLFSSVCDHVITHPNVVNASDINELPENGLYVEGSMLCRFLMGTIALQKVRSNRVLFVMDKHKYKEYNTLSINALNAARACYGLSCPNIIELSPRVRLTAEYTETGRATGFVSGIDHMISVLEEYRHTYDAVAISTIISVPDN